MAEKQSSKVNREPVEIVQNTPLPPEIVDVMSRQTQQREGDMKLEDYANIIEALRKIKPFRTTAPTSVPKTFLDAIEFYDTGGVRRVYFYINKTWRYVTLT